MKMKAFTVIMTIAMTSMVSQAAWSRGEGRGGHTKGGRGDECSMDHHLSLKRLKPLGLSKDQEAKLKDLREAKQSSIGKEREELKVAKKAFKEALRSGASREEVERAYGVMMEKKNKIAKIRMETLLSAREVLTTEQRAKLFEKRDKE